MDFESDEDRLNRISNEINNGQYRMKRADVVTVPQQYSAQGKFNPVDGNAHLVREIDSEGNVTNFDRSGNPVEPTFGERLSKIWNTVKSYAEENPEIEFPAQTLAEAIGNTITSTAGSVADSVKEMPLYRSVFLTDEERLADAEKIGTAIGINPQILADNQGLYENAKKIYDKQQAMEITGGQLFSVPTIQEMYPEVNLSDPVQAAIALKNAREVIESREAVQSGSIADGIKNEWNFIKNTWTKGYEAGEAGSEIASIWGQEDRGEISLDEAVEKINELEKKAKLPENRGPAETILSETAMQIARNANSFPQALGEGVTYAATSAENILGIPKGTILKWMNTNMALPSFAKYLGNHVLNNPAAALAVNAKFAPSIFIGAFRDSYYDNYQRMRLATDAFGKHKYTKEEARRLAAGEASVQAAIEQKGVEIAFGPVFRILSKGPAAALISNAGAVKALLGAGKQAAARTAMKQAGVQFAKGAAAEIGEEGAQDLVSSIVENALGHEDNSFAEIIKSAGEAMLQAVPSVIGMMAPGAAVHGVGTYRGMKTISVQELKAAQEEIKRENESSLLSRLMELKKSSKLFQKSPESYRTTLQNQMNQAGMGTIYIDAQAAAQNEATHEALNNLVSSGAVTAKELNQAITTGKPLEVKSGKYMQTATPEMNEALSDYTTMDKGERTMHAIREERQRNQDLVDLVRSSQKEREAKAGKAILDKYFPDTSTEEGKEDRDTMAELLSGGLSDLKTNTKNALDAALKDWGDLTGVKDIQDYMKGREGVFDKTASEKGVDTGSLDRDTMIRISKNPGWYQDFYKSYGRAPNARELYDIAHKKMEDEVYYNMDKNDAEGMAEKETMEAARRRVESLERVKDIVDQFDDKDIVAQSLLEPETYEQVYKPTVETLSQGNAAVKKSARDSALILSKMAENFHKNYGVPLKMAAVKIKERNGRIDIETGLSQKQFMTTRELEWMRNRMETVRGLSNDPAERDRFIKSNPIMAEEIKAAPDSKTKPSAEVINRFKAKYPNGTVVKTKIGTVAITARGIKNSLSHGMSKVKLAATESIPEGMKIASYVGSLKDFSGKPIINHFFAYKINFNGEDYVTICRVKENIDANKFYVHEAYPLMDMQKAEQSVSRDLAKSLRRSWGPALLYTSIIRHFLSGRNIEENSEFHQMAGERASTAMISRLQKAESMEREAASSKEIWEETGWMRGPDHKWRFEIPDNLDKINFPKDSEPHTLGEIYDNPALYEAYPELAQKTVRMEDTKSGKDKRTRGAYGYVAEDGSIVIDNSIPTGEAKTALVHEIQHSIQAIEGFSRGGNKEMAKKYISDTIDRLSMDLMDIEFKDPKAKEYMDLAEKITDSFDENDIMGSLGKIKELKERRKKLLESLPAGERKELSTIERDINLLEDAMKQDDYAAYRRLGGEAEAFMAEDRARNPSKSMPDYNTPYGPAVINYAGESLPFRMAEPDLVALHNLQVNQYFQGEKYLGAYDRDTNAIEIFDGANQSTVIHEGAHMYLSMLEEYASLSPAEMAQYFEGDESKAAASLQKITADLNTVREWAAYTEDHLKEYEGSSLEKEFTQYGKDIENGVEGAEERFMQERFARGFEKYLMEGSAPTKELKGVFRRFKSWLKDIYSAAKNLGNVKLTPEIKDIYDHMLATDKEVEAWAAQRKLDSIDKALNVNASEAENLKKWSEEVKEKAKEIALSYYMKTMKSDALDSFKKSIDTPEAKNEFARKLAEENPFFKIEQILHSGQLPTKADRENFLKMNNYESEEEFNEAVKMMGGTTEEQFRKHIDSEIQNFKDNMLTEEDVRAMAENVLESPEGLQKRANLEAALLEKRVNQYINEITTSQLKLKRASDKAKAAAEIRERLGLITPEDKAEMGRQTERIVKNEEKISKLEDQVKKLKDQLAKEKEKTKSESKEKTSDTLKDTESNVAELAVQLSDMVEGLKESRRAMKTDYKLMKDEAASTLGEETISHATSWKWWENKARIANARAMKAASQNNWEESAYQKNVEAQCLVMARTAKDNIEEIKRDLHGGGKLTTQQYNEEGMDRYGILGIINRIGRKEKPVLMNDDARYFVQHLAYMAGMTKRDGEKPIDENGLSRDFDWHALGLELNPDLGIKDGKYDGFDVIPPWMKALFDSNTPMKFEDLKMNDYRAIVKAIKAVYKIGRREYEGNTLGTSFEKAATDIQDEIMTNWKQQKITPMDKELSATSLQRIGTKFHKLVRDITLPEILIERLGEAAYKYIYIPIDKATAKRRQMKQDANKRIRSIFDIYSRKEWTRMRSKKEFEYGTDPSGAKRLYTKEQVLSMALNMGTQSNRARLIKTVGGNEAEMLNFLDSVMDKRDWGFVTKIWEHVGEYWGERNKIQNDLYGTPMGKVPGLKFTLKSGQVIHGQYYPIKYDHKTSSRSNEYFANNIASMDLQGISAFSLGMGSTKARENGSGGQKLRLDLDVYVSHISEAIQHVAMREATVDVFKLLSRKEVVSSLERTIGTEATNELRQWVSDNWHSSIIEMNEWEKGVNRLRHKFVFATMGYRLSTAILNVLNIFGMMERMGTYNALKATSDFYFGGGANKFRNIKEQYQFIISKSTFMRERAATMDRDMTMGDRIQVGQNEWEWSSKVRHGKYGIDTINSGAFKIIALTDEMFSLPEWLATYKGALAKMQSENSKMTMEEMDQEAIRLADKAVRETFGSGEMKDQTSFMRKGGNLAGLTTFFSYTNLVTNQFIRAGYALYDYHTVKPLLRATFFWWILNSFFETCLREMWDDSDDPDKWKKKLLYTFASGGPLGGIPILRDILPPTVNFITKGGKGPLLDVTPDVPAFDSVKYFGKALQSLYKGDTIETGRNFSKGLTRVTPYTLPDTLVDGYWNFMRMISSDNLTFTDWIYKSMFDKPLKEKK